MSRYGDDDGHGFDPAKERAGRVKAHLERLEEAAERAGSGPRQVGGGRNARPLTRIEKRLLDANTAILDQTEPEEVAYQHTVLCQTSMPYRPTTERVWVRRQGKVSLRMEAGAAQHPDTGEWIDLPLPHGEKPRLVLIHLNGEALRTGSPVLDVEGSMTAFVAALGLPTTGRNIRTLKTQLSRLAAARILFGIGPDTVKTDIIRQFRLWWPDDARQRVLWPSTVRLDPEYFANLQRHAVPLNSLAVAALSHSALALDIYAWLAQRLHRVPLGSPQPVTWAALKEQFGPDFDRMRDFRRKFTAAMKTVLTAYPGARVETADDGAGILLYTSPPPVAKRQPMASRLTPPTIDGTATEVPGEGDKPGG